VGRGAVVGGVVRGVEPNAPRRGRRKKGSGGKGGANKNDVMSVLKRNCGGREGVSSNTSKRSPKSRVPKEGD